MRVPTSLLLLLFSVIACANRGPSQNEAKPADQQVQEDSSPPPIASSDYCAMFYDRAYECGNAEEQEFLAGLQDFTIQECGKQKRDPEREKAEVTCMKKPDCEDYKQCLRELPAN